MNDSKPSSCMADTDYDIVKMANFINANNSFFIYLPQGNMHIEYSTWRFRFVMI